MRQLAFPPPRTWGGKRKGAGRKPKGPRPLVAHQARPDHDARHPCHVTKRFAFELPSLRVLFSTVRDQIAASHKEGFRILHFSLQDDHLHLIVEADDREALSRGVQGLSIRVARAVNDALGRRGAVWEDRYHARDLRTPREVRNALRYVLLNRHKHRPERSAPVDYCSSGPWFDGWAGALAAPRAPSPVRPPGTWLGGVGWRRLGLLRLDETPATG
jgi:REP element-mobilizing transposase RayT